MKFHFTLQLMMAATIAISAEATRGGHGKRPISASERTLLIISLESVECDRLRREYSLRVSRPRQYAVRCIASPLEQRLIRHMCGSSLDALFRCPK